MATERDEIMLEAHSLHSRVCFIENKLTNDEGLSVLSATRRVSEQVDRMLPGFHCEALMQELRWCSLELMQALGKRHPQVSFNQKMTLVRLVIQEGVERTLCFEQCPTLLGVMRSHENILSVPEHVRLVGRSKHQQVSFLMDGCPELYCEYLSVSRPTREVSGRLRVTYREALGLAAGDETAASSGERW